MRYYGSQERSADRGLPRAIWNTTNEVRDDHADDSRAAAAE